MRRHYTYVIKLVQGPYWGNHWSGFFICKLTKREERKKLLSNVEEVQITENNAVLQNSDRSGKNSELSSPQI